MMLLLVICFRSPFDLSAKRGLRKDMHKNYTSSINRTEPLISIPYLQNTRLSWWLEYTGIYCWPTVFNIWRPSCGETPVADFSLVVQAALIFEVRMGGHKSLLRIIHMYTISEFLLRTSRPAGPTSQIYTCKQLNKNNCPHGDDPEVTIRHATENVKSLKQLDEKQSSSLQVRIGQLSLCCVLQHQRRLHYRYTI